ncbi:hypothetical protein [Streptomyces sp. SID9727]|uniref:hypothetical protein n=1 Tax=Streptomyces sp. SID9727 TaxID=2706114 RepID=UPI0013CAFA1D|nr:hypothetical protein [Streptomyces sp. SID9727]NEC65392.1 hypothetical protein [Streptomyces sp. SID9727]
MGIDDHPDAPLSGCGNEARMAKSWSLVCHDSALPGGELLRDTEFGALPDGGGTALTAFSRGRTGAGPGENHRPRRASSSTVA